MSLGVGQLRHFVNKKIAWETMSTVKRYHLVVIHHSKNFAGIRTPRVPCMFDLMMVHFRYHDGSQERICEKMISRVFIQKKKLKTVSVKTSSSIRKQLAAHFPATLVMAPPDS